MTALRPTDGEGDRGKMVLLAAEPEFKTTGCVRCEALAECSGLEPWMPVMCEIPDEFDVTTIEGMENGDG